MQNNSCTLRVTEGVLIWTYLVSYSHLMFYYSYLDSISNLSKYQEYEAILHFKRDAHLIQLNLCEGLENYLCAKFQIDWLGINCYCLIYYSFFLTEQNLLTAI